MGLMTSGAVLLLGDAFTTLATAYVGGNPIALVKDLYGGRGGAPTSTICCTKVYGAL